ncbi:MAG: glycoside hydrolase family 3 C-terminal domain-containing protein [Treponemataceae bacterium]|nr:glycoside hydrolase family 3 C-terminal domain-containing protein [Treponemataceae bacterium]
MNIITKASYSDAVSEREKRNLDIAYKLACEAIVLMKNENVLPMNIGKIALFGSGIIETIKGGTGSGEVNERHSVSIFEGFKEAGWEITNEKCHLAYHEKYEKAKKDFVVNQRKKAYSNIFKIIDTMFEPFRALEFDPITMETIKENQTDNCIYIVSRQAGEGGDRKTEKGDLLLSDREKSEIELLAKNYKNFVLIINSGSQIDMSFVDEIPEIKAILYICQLGTKGGNAIADVVSGKVNPSGKLSDTWAKKYSDIPFSDEYSYLNGNLKNEYYKEGIYVGYRYFDSFNKDVRYPFGFGLSYTQFEISDSKVTLKNTKKEIKVKISCKVSNKGKIAGKEVLQAYLTCPDKYMKKEFQSLAGFAKTNLIEPGKSELAEIEFDLKDMASFDEKTHSYILENGDYLIRLGNSSRNTKIVSVIEVENEKPFTVSSHDEICSPNDKIDELTSPERKAEDYKDAERIKIKIDLEPEIYKFTLKDKPGECQDMRVQDLMKKLSIRQMATICVGDSMTPKNPFFKLPGSVGNTTSKFAKLGLANAPMCDGPAGIRLQKRAALTKKGKIKPVDSALGVFDIMIPDFIKKFTNGNPEKDTLIYQYTTAFPVANAVAQTWNLELARQMGLAVQAEMEEYGCTFWLAPAVNIHRNPLCGRNFEYFSEDPLLAGKMAASITKGVQSKEGFYVTVKHFAANNQEDNRNNVSSNMSERTLREIYLKPFKLAVMEGNAKAIMSAYNKINGIYCANSYDLCTKVLRLEWDFDGIVMTDWMASFMGKVSDPLCMSAGNDLIMPGGSFFRDRVINGLNCGKIKKEDIRICCSRLLKLLLNSAIQKEYIDNK